MEATTLVWRFRSCTRPFANRFDCSASSASLPVCPFLTGGGGTYPKWLSQWSRSRATHDMRRHVERTTRCRPLSLAEPIARADAAGVSGGFRDQDEVLSEVYRGEPAARDRFGRRQELPGRVRDTNEGRKGKRRCNFQREIVHGPWAEMGVLFRGGWCSHWQSP